MALLLPSALVVEDPQSWPELVLLFAAPLLAGSVGATYQRFARPGEEDSGAG